MDNLRVISLGAGVQSTALYFMSSMGELPRVDYAIFADTGKEKSGTIAYLEYLSKWAILNNGIPLIHIQQKNLYYDLLDTRIKPNGRFASIPAFTKNNDGTKGMLRRQCTYEYKIRQIDKAIREIHGLKQYQRTPKTQVWKGISLDEIERVSIPQQRWKTEVYPFVGYQTNIGAVEKISWGRIMTRINLLSWYEDHQLPVPPKSSCTFCPYQPDAAWKDMKENNSDDWYSAIMVDRAIRNSTAKGITQPIYLHDSCIPLEDVVFAEDHSIWKGECSGNCHT